ncbi:YbaB/EbfC family nucleoid-associated protein [Lacticaseibacillus hulanensis]|uniref:YbaB/EbfC family nucleoid-associated protein n=1 Tax=Lacticaseibacillus hulanensis TaxID=2493111 RepID=UPI000FDC12D0|nr:YbaB/EbfC family nucleoid-associated protein [Lacticaseibacillus hulanensis]
MGNMQNMMRQVKKMQKDMEKAQADLNAATFTGTSAQDLVTATFTGDRKMTELSIKPEAIDPDDPDMVADLVLEAVNNALAEVEKETQAKMGKYTRGMGI